MNEREVRRSDIALIGLAVMGENLVLNMESKGFKVSVYNRTGSVTDNFIKGRAKGRNIEGFATLPELIASLKVPRKVMMMPLTPWYMWINAKHADEYRMAGCELPVSARNRSSRKPLNMTSSANAAV